jgi:uncharacterized protein (DUF1330 family)
MRSVQVLNTTVGATVVTSSVYTARERPDQFGFAVVRHGGSKIASGSTIGTIEGSFDQTTWFVIDSFKTADAEYVAESETGNPLNSWNKVVPLAPYMRIRLINGGNNTFQAWIAE